MRSLVLMMSLAVAAVGCDRADATSKPNDTSPRTDQQKVDNAPADNTKKNERDRDTSTVTPGDQGNNDLDLGITQKIRQGIMKDDTFSMNGKNVKVISQGGVVTLRGPVDSDKEKSDIAAIALRVDGVKRVDNQLEVKSK